MEILRRFRVLDAESTELVIAKYGLALRYEEGMADQKITSAICEASVKKLDIGKANPRLKELGRSVYTWLVEQIGRLPAEFHHDVEHIVARMPTPPLTVERWNELFEGFLREHGYIAVKDGKWTKTYRYIPKK